MSGRAVEAAGDCSTLLLDKTGTITYGNRQAAQFLPVLVSTSRRSPMPPCSSLADEDARRSLDPDVRGRAPRLVPRSCRTRSLWPSRLRPA